MGHVVVFALLWLVVASGLVALDCSDDGCGNSSELTLHLLFNGVNGDEDRATVRVSRDEEARALGERVLNASSDAFDLEGRRVTSLANVRDGQTLVLVPLAPQFVSQRAARPLVEPWMWPGVKVGHKTLMAGVEGPDGGALFLETLSLLPRVFSVEGFLSAREACRL
jgi:hypothetical protein